MRSSAEFRVHRVDTSKELMLRRCAGQEEAAQEVGRREPGTSFSPVTLPQPGLMWLSSLLSLQGLGWVPRLMLWFCQLS